MEERFYYCKDCGGIFGLIHSEQPSCCCKSALMPIAPKRAETGAEKHLPKVAVLKDRVLVDVGEIAHPMESAHHIGWIYLQTNRGGQRKTLVPQQPPRAEFALLEERPLAVYAYCNQHGLWKIEL